MKMLDIVEGYGNWIRLEDDKWYNFSVTDSVTDKGNVYLDGKLVKNSKIEEKKIYEPIRNRFEILDL